MLIPPGGIREQDPLKQGLKPVTGVLSLRQKTIREQDPLKQGLKLFHCLYYVQSYIIREQDPLKQGLKQEMAEDIINEHEKFVSKIH